MASVIACVPVPDVPSSSAGASRDASGSQPDGRVPPRGYHRLTRSADFDRVMREGVRARSGLVTVVARPRTGQARDGGSDEATGARVGFVVGRRVGSAVRRNRAKRRLREAVRVAPLRADTDYVLVAGSETVTAPWPELVEAVRRSVERANERAR